MSGSYRNACGAHQNHVDLDIPRSANRRTQIKSRNSGRSTSNCACDDPFAGRVETWSCVFLAGDPSLSTSWPVALEPPKLKKREQPYGLFFRLRPAARQTTRCTRSSFLQYPIRNLTRRIRSKSRRRLGQAVNKNPPRFRGLMKSSCVPNPDIIMSARCATRKHRTGIEASADRPPRIRHVAYETGPESSSACSTWQDPSIRPTASRILAHGCQRLRKCKQPTRRRGREKHILQNTSELLNTGRSRGRNPLTRTSTGLGESYAAQSSSPF